MAKAVIKRYKEQRDLLRREFQAEKVGNQTLFTDQTKLFRPLIESQKETSKDLQDKLVSNQNTLSNTLVPFTNELKRRNDQVEQLQALPFYAKEEEHVPHSTSKSKDIMIDINGELLNQTHAENLAAMNFELPSIVGLQDKGSRQAGTLESILQKIISKKRSLNQLIGKTGEKRSETEKENFRSQRSTLEIYERKIRKLMGVDEFIVYTGKGGPPSRKLCKQKRGKGRPRKYPDTVFYNSANDLCQKLYELVAAKKAGNTGLDNSINSILEELLNIGAVNKEFYNTLFKCIF